MSRRAYCEIDVFSGQPYGGNPLAVVVDARGLTTAQMQEFARWTNLSETAFLLPPGHTGADYRTRIFTPARELDFAGHPTLGSCQAWLLQGGQPRGGEIVQECGVGLVRLRREAMGLAFCAPPLHRRPVAADTLAATAAALGISPAAIKDAQWLRNGPDWLSLLLESAEQVLALDPDYAQLARIGTVGVIGPARAPGAGTGGTDFEVRAFAPGDGIPEDPVTGSLNAALGQWLTESGVAPARYRVAQGTRLGRAGRVQIVRDGADVWVGGDCHALVTGEVDL